MLANSQHQDLVQHSNGKARKLEMTKRHVQRKNERSQGVGAGQRGGENLATREAKLVGPRQDEVLGSMSFLNTTLPEGHDPASSVFFPWSSLFCFLLLTSPYASHIANTWSTSLYEHITSPLGCQAADGSTWAKHQKR